MEGRRIFTSRLLLAVLAGLLVMNSFFYLYSRPDKQVNQMIYGKEYHQRIEQLAQIDWESVVAWCKEYEQALIAAGMENYDLDRERDKQITQQILRQYEHLLGYEDYVSNIHAQAKLLQSLSLFGDPNTIAYKNTVKTSQDFSALDGIVVTPGHDLAVTSFFQDSWTDYSLVVVVFVVCALFLAERKEGLWSIIHACKGGRTRLACKRVLILLGTSWIASVILIGSRVFLCGLVYHGLGEWDRTLQSIPTFYNVPIPMTVGQFWLLYIAVKAFGTFWLGLVLWTLMSALANIALAIGAAGLVMGVEYACMAIPSSSAFAAARYVNVFSYVEFSKVITRYLNISVFGRLISGCDLVLLLLPVLCLVFTALAVWINRIKRPVAMANPVLKALDRIVRWLDPVFSGGGEVRKLLVRRKGILILLLLLLAVSKMESAPRAYVAWDPYVQHYQKQYAGPIDAQKLEQMEQALTSGIDSYNQKGLSIVFEDAASLPQGRWIVHSAPYEAVWSNNENNYHRTTVLLVMMILAMLMAPIASQERQNDMLPLLTSTVGGRGRLMVQKQILLLLLTGFVWAAVYGNELRLIIQEYGPLTGLAAPADSISIIRPLGWTIPLWLLLVLTYLWRLLVMVAVSEVCFFLSSRCRKNRDAVLLCCGVIVIPAALAAIGSAIGEYLSFLIPLGGSELLHIG